METIPNQLCVFDTAVVIPSSRSACYSHRVLHVTDFGFRMLQTSGSARYSLRVPRVTDFGFRVLQSSGSACYSLRVPRVLFV